ncbi:MAG: hypothetical protein ACPGUX_00175 [Halocynthiibacter sp.]
MSEERTDRFWRKNNPILWGIILSVIFIGIYGWLAVLETCGVVSCESKWQEFLSASPNEIGDTLAGIFGGLAFLWIIMTVLLQSQELREQRRELRQARGEYEKMANAMQKQAKVADQQISILQQEQRQRDELRADRLFNQKLTSFVQSVIETPSQGLHWCFSNDIIDDETGGNGQIHALNLYHKDMHDQTVDETLIGLRRRLPGLRESLWEYTHTSIDYRLPDSHIVILYLVAKLEDLSRMKADISDAEQERLEMFRLPEIVQELQELSSTPQLWADTEK